MEDDGTINLQQIPSDFMGPSSHHGSRHSFSLRRGCSPAHTMQSAINQMAQQDVLADVNTFYGIVLRRTVGLYPRPSGGRAL